MERTIAYSMASSEGNSWIGKPKLERLSLMFRGFSENSCVIDTKTQTSTNLERNCQFCKLIKIS